MSTTLKKMLFKILSSDKISVLGKVPVTEVNELFGKMLIPISDDYETVAGLVISKAGDIPKEGYSFKLNGYKLTVKEILKKRIKRVEIDKYRISLNTMRKGCFIKSVVFVTILIAVIIYLIEYKFDDWIVRPGKKLNTK